MRSKNPNRKLSGSKTRLYRAVLAASPRCAYCGFSRSRTIDHLVPISRGGSKGLENVVAACRECNQAKRDRTPEEWAADILLAAVLAEEAAGVLASHPSTEGGAA